MTSAPAACSWAPQRIDLFWRGPEGTLEHKWYDGSWWSPDRAVLEDRISVDAPLVAQPTVCTWGRDRLDVFWRDGAGRLHHQWYDHGWGEQRVLETQVPLASDPAAVALGHDNIHLFWQRPDGEMHHKWWNAGAWRGEESLGGRIIGTPAATSMASGVVDVVAGSPSGELMHRWYDGEWHGWRSRAWDRSAPAVCSWRDGRLDFALLNGAGELHHAYWDEIARFTNSSIIRTVWEFMADHRGDDRLARQRAAFATGSLGGHCSGAMISPHVFMTASHCGGPGGVDTVRFFHTDHLGNPVDEDAQQRSDEYVARTLPWQHSGISSNVPDERGDTILMWLDDGPDGVAPGIKYGFQELTREPVQAGDTGYSFYRNPAFRRDDVLLYSKGPARHVHDDHAPFQGPSIDYEMWSVGGISGSTNLSAVGAGTHHVVGVTQGGEGLGRQVPKVTEFLRRYDADNNAVPDAVDYDWLVTKPILTFRLLTFDTPLARSHWVAVPHGSAVGTGPMGTLSGLPRLEGAGSGRQAGSDGYWHQTSRFRSGATYRISVLAAGRQMPPAADAASYIKFHSDRTHHDVTFAFNPTPTASRHNGIITLGDAVDYRLIIGTAPGTTLEVESIVLIDDGTPVGFNTADERRSWEYTGDCTPRSWGMSTPKGFSAVVVGPSGNGWGIVNRHLAFSPNTHYRFDVFLQHHRGPADAYATMTDRSGRELWRQHLQLPKTGPAAATFEAKIDSDPSLSLGFGATGNTTYTVGDVSITKLGET